MTRRRWIGAVAGSGLGLCLAPEAFGAADFWNKKEPLAWSSDEVLLLTTRSPWARDTRIDLKPNGQGAAGDRGGSDLTVDPNTRGGSSIGAGGGRTPGRLPDATVTWESAQPLLDALKYPIPAEFANHYAIGVANLPIVVEGGRLPRKGVAPSPSAPPRAVDQEELLDWLKNGAILRAKSRDPVQAGVVRPARGGAMILFGFSQELLPLSVSDRDVVFTLDNDQLSLKARFDPKEMIYRGKLAL